MLDHASQYLFFSSALAAPDFNISFQFKPGSIAERVSITLFALLSNLLAFHFIDSQFVNGSADFCQDRVKFNCLRDSLLESFL